VRLRLPGDRRQRGQRQREQNGERARVHRSVPRRGARGWRFEK
jgi:hypothetical protein